MLEFTPILIGFPLEISLKREVVLLNQNCNPNRGIDFNIHIPHITLWMGFVENGDLEILRKSFYKVFHNINFQTTIEGSGLFKGIDGYVLSLNILKNKSLDTLQNRIHHFFEPFRKKITDFKEFSYSTLEYANHFNKKSLEQFEPHITIGFSDNMIDFKPKHIQLSNPKIFLMGNNCTCLEVISS